MLLEGRPGRFCAGLDLKVLPTLGREGVRWVLENVVRFSYENQLEGCF